MVRWCWVNFQCRIIWIIVGHVSTTVVVGADEGCLVGWLVDLGLTAL